jgi:peroxiredoxin
MKMLAAKIVKAGLLLPLSGLVLLLAGGPATAASVGELAPDFEIATQDGAVFRLSDYRGRKPVYVVFWNSWCSYCIRRTPRYIKLQEQFSDKIEIIAINTTAFDAGESVTDQYGVRKVPTEFIVDVNGIIRYRDRVPEYLAAHLPDWLLPYIPSDHTAQLVCKK